MKTSLVERTPGAGRQANFSSGMASDSASNWLDTWRHSPSYPCQIPSGAVCASKGRALNNKRSAKSAFLMVCLVSGSFILGRQNYGNPFYTRREDGMEGRGRRPGEGAAKRFLSTSANKGPAREGAAGKEGFGGPLAEVDGESDAVAVVAGEKHHLFVARM